MDPKELAALKDGSLELDCVRMTLTKGDGSKTYSGPGYIRQRDKGGFGFKLFADGKLDYGMLFSPNNAKAGELLREKHSWQLVAEDTKGRSWKAVDIWKPIPDGHLDKSGFVILGNFHELTRAEDSPYNSKFVSIEMVTFQQFDFPCNQASTITHVVGQETPNSSSEFNAAKFACCGFEFLLHNEGDLIRLKVWPETTSLHPYLEQRVTEALQFALGVAINWSFIQRYENVRLTITVRAETRKKVPFPYPPIAYPYPNAQGIWELFELYLRFIYGRTECEVHPVSAQLSAVNSSRTSSIQVQMLTLSMAVESVLVRCFSDISTKPQKEIEEIDAAMRHMDTWEGNESIKKRTRGVIGNLKKTRAIDKLYVLVGRHAVNEPNVKVWKKARDSVSHGALGEMGDTQSIIDDAGSIRVLLYQLIFHLIGHTGKQTDWETHGRPLIDYPPVAAATS